MTVVVPVLAERRAVLGDRCRHELPHNAGELRGHQHRLKAWYASAVCDRSGSACKARGRPVGVAIDSTGALLVADDVGNTIWRVTSASQTAATERSLTPRPAACSKGKHTQARWMPHDDELPDGDRRP